VTCFILLSAHQIAQFDKLKGTIEEYADYVAKLALEREATLRLKGENGIMKKKFSTLNKQASHSFAFSGASPSVTRFEWCTLIVH
jgi:hypothetical protein